MTTPGNLFIISAPSGAGKSSLVHALMERLPEVTFSVSHTTRAPRPGEENGRDYHFVDLATFEAMLAAGDFIEHARVFDNYYGTARSGIEGQLAAGNEVFLDIDWQGARQIRKLWPEVVSIFVLPPSREALEDRLRGRGQDDAATIARRMAGAVAECRHFNEYDYLIINDDFTQALDELECLVRAARLRLGSQQQRHAQLLAGLLENGA